MWIVFWLIGALLVVHAVYEPKSDTLWSQIGVATFGLAWPLILGLAIISLVIANLVSISMLVYRSIRRG
jgi:hypothetical protein